MGRNHTEKTRPYGREGEGWMRIWTLKCSFGSKSRLQKLQEALRAHAYKQNKTTTKNTEMVFPLKKAS